MSNKLKIILSCAILFVMMVGSSVYAGHSAITFRIGKISNFSMDMSGGAADGYSILFAESGTLSDWNYSSDCGTGGFAIRPQDAAMFATALAAKINRSFVQVWVEQDSSRNIDGYCIIEHFQLQ